MQVVNIYNQGLENRIKIVVSKDEINNNFQEEIESFTVKAKIPGFRPGKVPKSFVLQRYGQDIRQDVVQNIIRRSFSDFLESIKEVIMGDPIIEKIDNEEEKDVEIYVTYEVKPKVDVIDLSKISIEKPKIKVSDSKIEEAYNKYLINYASYEDTDNGAKDHDMVVVNGLYNEKSIKSQNLVIDIKNNDKIISTISNALVGVKSGDVRDVTIDDAKFNFTIEKVKKHILPEVNEEFLKKIKQDSVETLREKIAQNLEKEYESEAFIFLKRNLFDQLQKMLRFDVPPSMLKSEIEIMKDSLKDSISEDEIRKIAERRVRIGFFISDYSQKNNLSLDKEEVSAALLNSIDSIEPSRRMEFFNAVKNNPQLAQRILSPELENKIVRQIIQSISVEEKEYSSEEFDKKFEDLIEDI